MNKDLHTLKRKTLTTSIFSYGKVTGAIVFDLRREKKDGVFPVKYRITYLRKQKYYDSGFSFSIEDWGKLPTTRTKSLLENRSMLESGYRVIEQHVKDMVVSNSFSFQLLTKRISRGDNSSINTAYDRKISELKANGQVGTAMIYDCAIKSLTNFNKSRELLFTSISVEWIRKYEKWFIGAGNSYATLSMYLRTLRHLFNKAKRDNDIPETIYPFGQGRYEIKSSPGRKMALNLDQLKKIVLFEVEPGTTTEKIRDLFLFSYMANGMNMKDLICLKWKSIKAGEIVYFREKTKETSKDKKAIEVPVLPEMEVILDKWGTVDRSSESFVFGYLEGKPSPDRIRTVSQNLTRQMNKHLKKIGKAAGLPHISTYTARHSFSTVLLNAGASIEFISESLGHSDISTTRAYLAGFETETRRKMNLNLLNFNMDNHQESDDINKK